MTIIRLTTTAGRLDQRDRSELAAALTDAVCEVECGQITHAGRSGFQVRFETVEPDAVAVGGELVSETGLDPMHLDISVMEGDWPLTAQRRATENCFGAIAEVLGHDRPKSTWWSTVRFIDEGSFGAAGTTISILDLLDTGAFTDEQATAIRTQLTRTTS